MKKIYVIFSIFILLLVGFIIYINQDKQVISSEIAKCIGEQSELYVQLGCVHCKTQEKMFGDKFHFLNTTDCFYEPEKCNKLDIRVTPTWIIRGQKVEGVQEIETLKRLTNC